MREKFWVKILFCFLFIFFILILQIKPGSTNSRRYRGPKWWNLGRIADTTNLISNDIISNSLNEHHLSKPVKDILRKKQRRLIRENEGVLVAVAEGAKKAVQSCKYQFRTRRWNCSSAMVSAYRKNRGIFGRIVSLPCRETAFLYALTSAATLHSVTRACTEGSVQTCTCDYRSQGPTGEDWEWGGCSENIEFGYRFSREFVDAGEKHFDHRAAMNLHNNEAGRQHVKASMRSECKCHGMSGSCAVKTCWTRLPHFWAVGNTLKERFDGASRVLNTNAAHLHPNNLYPRGGNSGRRIKRKRRKKKKKKYNFVPFNPDHKEPSILDIVYLADSPDFCIKNKSLGIAGTVGRECNASSIGVDGCDLMCCGRGYRSRTIEVVERCSCLFRWCCEVKCKICKKQKTIHTCY